MHFKFQYGLVGTILAATAIGAAIERNNVESSYAEAQLISEKGDDVAILAAGRFRFCIDPYFVDCGTFAVDRNICYNLSAQWNNMCSSAIAFDGLQCYIWTEFNCQGYYGGPVTGDNRFSNLADYGYDNAPSSFICY